MGDVTSENVKVDTYHHSIFPSIVNRRVFSAGGDDDYHAFLGEDVFVRVVKLQNARFVAILIADG